MPNDRDLYKQVAHTQKPESMQREVPKKAVSREQAAREEREKQVSAGVPTTWRLHPDIKPALRRAAELENVTQRELVEYILTKALVALANGSFVLPKKQTGSIYSIESPDVPSTFLE
jgi:hypothetical protein